MDAYEDIKPLGRGSYAVVRLVRKLDTSELFVVKRFHVPLTELTAKERTEIANEIRLLAHLKHPNIIQFVNNFVDNGVVHIVMEYATGGTLNKKIANRSGELFPEDEIWEMFVQIVMALKYVHSRNILHRDLKAENIMMSGLDERVIKLGDFGIAKVLGSQADMAATIVGTPHTLSPELVQGQPYDQKSDVWALGCVLYEMCALKKPFDASNLPAIIFSIMRNKPQGIPEEYSDHLKKMVKLLLSANPAERPSLAEIEALPVIQHYMNKWREDYRELEVAAGLGPSAITAPSSRTAATGPGSMSTRSPMMATGSPGSADWAAASSMALTGVGSAATPLTSPAATKATVAAFEREMLREIEEFAVEAETAPGTGSAGLHTRIDECQRKLEAGPAVSGRVWESLGRAWADSGQFSRAIAAYRRSLRAKSSNASLVAMEQLGNLLVRRAQQVWSQARAGDPEGALKAAEEVLAGGTTSASALLQRITAKKARGAKAKRSSSAVEDDGGTEEDEEDVPAWARAASALMYEGLAYIERMCSLGNTAERRSLLGSAYKRRAWTGLGESRKEDLIQAASNYAAAHEIEMEDGKENPSPYARLNQLTLEMLAGSGTIEERERWLLGIREAEAWATVRKEEDPADVWLWVQAVDARSLRFLLDDEGVSGDDVVAGYREQFAFGANQRVKSSVMDQLSFLIQVLQGRVTEVEEEAKRKAEGKSKGHSDSGRELDADPTGVREIRSRPGSPVEASRVREWLLQVMAKVQDLKKRLERHMAADTTKSADGPSIPTSNSATTTISLNGNSPNSQSASAAGLMDPFSPRAATAYAHGYKGDKTKGSATPSFAVSSLVSPAFKPDVGDAETFADAKREKRSSRGHEQQAHSSPSSDHDSHRVRRLSSKHHSRRRDADKDPMLAGTPIDMTESQRNMNGVVESPASSVNPFSRRASKPFESSRRKSIDAAVASAESSQCTPLPTPPQTAEISKAARNPFARSTPAGERFHSKKTSLHPGVSGSATDRSGAVPEERVIISADTREHAPEITQVSATVNGSSGAAGARRNGSAVGLLDVSDSSRNRNISLPNAVNSPVDIRGASATPATPTTAAHTETTQSTGSRRFQNPPALIIIDGNSMPAQSSTLHTTMGSQGEKKSDTASKGSTLGATMSSAIVNAARAALGVAARHAESPNPSPKFKGLEGPASISSQTVHGLPPAQSGVKPMTIDDIATPTGVSANLGINNRTWSPTAKQEVANSSNEAFSLRRQSRSKEKLSARRLPADSVSNDMVASMFSAPDATDSGALNSSKAGILAGIGTGDTSFRGSAQPRHTSSSGELPRPSGVDSTATSAANVAVPAPDIKPVSNPPQVAVVKTSRSWCCG